MRFKPWGQPDVIFLINEPIFNSDGVQRGVVNGHLYEHNGSQRSTVSQYADEIYSLKTIPVIQFPGMQIKRHRLASRSLECKLKFAAIATVYIYHKLDRDYSTLWRNIETWYQANSLDCLSDIEFTQWIEQAYKLGLTRPDTSEALTDSQSGQPLATRTIPGEHIPASKFMLEYKKWKDRGFIRHESNRDKRYRIFAGLGKAAILVG